MAAAPSDTSVDAAGADGRASADRDERAAAVLAAAERLADQVLFPAAQEVDRAAAIPPGHLEALAAAGLFGIAGPLAHDGVDLDPSTARRVMAAVGSGCGATFFVWVQHHGVVRGVRASPNEPLARRLLADLCTGRAFAGTAFAHVRRLGPPAITARRTGSGWRLDGVAPWATSWGLADQFSVSAVSAAGEMVTGLLPAGDVGDAAGVTARPLALPVFGATATVELRFDDCRIDDASVIAVESVDVWRRTDRPRTGLGQPAVLGVADRTIRLLGEVQDPVAVDTSELLTSELAARWARDDSLLDRLGRIGQEDLEEFVVDASDHRAASLELAQRAATGLLAAVGGRGMDLSHPAQRLAREAAFYVIQAQNADGRAATLRAAQRAGDRRGRR